MHCKAHHIPRRIKWVSSVRPCVCMPLQSILDPCPTPSTGVTDTRFANQRVDGPKPQLKPPPPPKTRRTNPATRCLGPTAGPWWSTYPLWLATQAPPQGVGRTNTRCKTPPGRHRRAWAGQGTRPLRRAYSRALAGETPTPMRHGR